MFREVIPFPQALDLELTLPGSKSITNRAFLCAALAKGKSVIRGALLSDDTNIMLNALRKLEIGNLATEGSCTGLRSNNLRKGVQSHSVVELRDDTVVIEGCGGQFTDKKLTLDLHNAGTAVRFLTAVMTIRKGETVITGNQRMQERPIGDLVEGLRQLGANIEYLGEEGYPPFKIQDSKFPPRRAGKIQDSRYVVKMKGDTSSQYFSALLMLAPLLDRLLQLEVIGDLVSKPYIDTTIAVMKAFGVKVQNDHYKSFLVKPQAYKACEFTVEGDASAASYFTSIHYLHEGKLKFTNLNTNFDQKMSKKIVQGLNKYSIQGDVAYSRALVYLGKGKIDMNSMPDVAMTLAVTAPFTLGKTTITNIGNLRVKETDRLKALETELKKIGVNVETTFNSIIVLNSKFEIRNSKLINTYNDHRMAMCFAVMGTKIPGILIENPDCVNKTYPCFWRDLERAYLSPIHLGQKHLVLTGMRCSGKSHLGKRIAQHLNRPFVDLDKEIEKDQEMTVAEIVERKGWEYFRKVEQKICSVFAPLSSGKSFVPSVIATGGGVVLNPDNMEVFKKNAVNVFIFADLSVLAERLKKKKGSRPSLTGRDSEIELMEVWQKRRPLYLKYADVVWDNTSGETIKENLNFIF